MASVSIFNKYPVRTKRIEKTNYGTAKIITGNRSSVVSHTLPFRIRFTAIQIPGYSPTTVPPIPLQVIGFSNYIL
jgi:hypothetical protein